VTSLIKSGIKTNHRLLGKGGERYSWRYKGESPIQREKTLGAGKSWRVRHLHLLSHINHTQKVRKKNWDYDLD